MPAANDISTRFLFKHADVRGNLVRLDQSYREVIAPHPYPPAVQQLVGEFLACAVLLSETIKFKGRLVLQARTDGPIRMLLAEANDQREVRAIATLDTSQPLVGDFPVLFYGGTLVVIVERQEGETYQSLVPIQGRTLAECLEHYFAQSEQLNTLIRLHADETTAGGFLLQELPPQRVTNKTERRNLWQHLSILGATISGGEMNSLTPAEMLKRLFVEEDIEVYRPQPVLFACSCSETRLANSLAAMGQAELDQLFAETPTLSLTCEFCQTEYRFDAARLSELVGGDEA